MKYKDFINESSSHNHVNEITEDELIKIIKENCSKADLDSPLLRGMRDVGDYLRIDGDTINRTSKDGNNIYTVCFDEYFKKNNYPLRSKSVICATNDQHAFVSSYGTPYVIIPYNDVSLAVCDNEDIYYSYNNTIEMQTINITVRLNDLLNAPRRKVYKSIDDIKDDVSKLNNEVIEKRFAESERYKPLIDYIEIDLLKSGDVDKITNKIVSIYDPKHYEFELTNNSNVGKYEEREVWFSGKCVAIKEEIWDELKDKL